MSKPLQIPVAAGPGTNESAPKEYSARWTGVACGLGVIAIFAGFTLASRLGYATALGPLDIIALRFGVGGAILLPLFLRVGLGGLALWQAAVLAALGGWGFTLIAYTGLSLAPASHGAVLMHGTLPLFTFLILTLASRERAAPRRKLGLALIAAGIVAMAWDSAAGASASQLRGDVLLLLGSLCWSGYGVLAQRWQVRPAAAAALVAVLSLALFLPFYLASGVSALSVTPWSDLVLQAVVQGVIVGGASIFVYSKAVAILGASTTALFTAAIPCVTTLAAIPLLGEWPSALAITGVVIVSAGLVTSIARISTSTPPTKESGT